MVLLTLNICKIAPGTLQHFMQTGQTSHRSTAAAGPGPNWSRWASTCPFPPQRWAHCTGHTQLSCNNPQHDPMKPEKFVSPGVHPPMSTFYTSACGKSAGISPHFFHLQNQAALHNHPNPPSVSDAHPEHSMLSSCLQTFSHDSGCQIKPKNLNYRHAWCLSHIFYLSTGESSLLLPLKHHPCYFDRCNPSLLQQILLKLASQLKCSSYMTYLTENNY